MIGWSLFVDPGFAKSNATGWAMFKDKRLYSAGIATAKAKGFAARCDEIARQLPTTASSWDLLGVELPMIYAFANQKGDPDDIVKLAFLAGALTRVPHKELWLPRPQEWKGSVPKSLMGPRILKRLEPDECTYFDLVKDRGGAALDAVGMGIVRAGRWG